MNRDQRARYQAGKNPGYDKKGVHPWDGIFVAHPDGSFSCGPCLPDGIDPGDDEVQVWREWSHGWLAPIMCTHCKMSLPVVCDGKPGRADRKRSEVDALVLRLLRTCGGQIILNADWRARVFIVAARLSGASAEVRPVPEMEYQVSNGVPGDRSESQDVATYEEALRIFRRKVRAARRAA